MDLTKTHLYIELNKMGGSYTMLGHQFSQKFKFVRLSQTIFFLILIKKNKMIKNAMW